MFHTLVEQLADPGDAGHATHTELEQLLTTRARELMPQLLQEHLDLRAQRDQRLSPTAIHPMATRRRPATVSGTPLD
jgi:hypothetical protein